MELHPTCKIIDSSKITEYMTCPRKFFYRYILGWRLEQPQTGEVRPAESVDLDFGEGWHLAMAHLLDEKSNRGYSDLSVAKAYIKFEDFYRKRYGENEDEFNFPKVPSVAYNALSEYGAFYNEDDFKVLDTEIPFSVIISNKPDRILYGKMDAVIENELGFTVWEHKTTTMTLSEIWRAQWYLKMQPYLYSYALYSHLIATGRDPGRFWGLMLNAASFTKAKGAISLCRVPIRKTQEDLNEFIIFANSWFSRIEEDLGALSKCSPDDGVLGAFAKNPESCTKYFRKCPYYEFCLSWKNPLTRTEPVQIGFEIEFWDPRNLGKTKSKEREKNDLRS